MERGDFIGELVFGEGGGRGGCLGMSILGKEDKEWEGFEVRECLVCFRNSRVLGGWNRVGKWSVMGNGMRG